MPGVGPESPQAALARAKAEKAYAKAGRKWYQKKRFKIPMGLLVFVVFFPIGNRLGSPSSTTAVDTTPVVQTQEPSNSTQEATTDAPAEPQEEPQEQVARIGDAATTGDLTVSVTNAEVVTTLESAAWGDKSGNWVRLDVSVTNGGTEAATVNNSSFILVAADGSRYETDADTLMYLDDDLFLEKINPKLTATGQVLFAIPESFVVEESTLEFSAGLFSQPAEVLLAQA